MNGGLKNYKYFARLDFWKWNQIIKLHPDDVERTAFEADGGLFEFLFLPEGLPNTVATFERAMKAWIDSQQLSDVHIVQDQVIVGGYTYDHYRENGRKLENALAKEGINPYPRWAGRMGPGTNPEKFSAKIVFNSHKYLILLGQFSFV